MRSASLHNIRAGALLVTKVLVTVVCWGISITVILAPTPCIMMDVFQYQFNTRHVNVNTSH